MQLPDEIACAVDRMDAAGVASVVKWLDGGGHVDARDRDFNQTLLIMASNTGQERLVNVLLSRGARTDLESLSGSALLGATMHGNLPIARRLLQAGARPDQAFVNHKGVSVAPLAMAERMGYVHVAQLLRENMVSAGLEIGTRLIVRALVSRPELNGRSVSVLGRDPSSGRYIIEVETADGAPSRVKIKRENLDAVRVEEDPFVTNPLDDTAPLLDLAQRLFGRSE